MDASTNVPHAHGSLLHFLLAGAKIVDVDVLCDRLPPEADERQAQAVREEAAAARTGEVLEGIGSVSICQKFPRVG